MHSAGIYRVEFAGDEDRPVLDYRIPANGDLPWRTYVQVMNGELPVSEYEPVHLIVRGKRAKDWHSYFSDGYGLISKAVVEVIEPYLRPCFELLPAFVNEVPFYFLRTVGSLDVLDREHSEIVLWDDEPRDIRKIRRYRFFKDRIPDPIFFRIPEIFGRFATAGIKTMIEERKFKGFYFHDTDTTEFT